MNIAIMFGGPSVEHDISIITAKQVFSAIDKKKYKIMLIYYSKDKKFYITPNFEYFEKSKEEIKLLDEVSINRLGAKKRGKFSKRKPIDFVICTFHGKNTESGELAGYLDTLGIPYSSNSVLGASIGQDKVTMKKILTYDGINVLPFKYLDYEGYLNIQDEWYDDLEKFGYPIIIKPSNLGSSIGIKKVNDKQELKKALNYAFKFDKMVILEQCLEDFREFNCAIFNGITSSIEEVKVNNEIFSFKDKYETDEISHILPAEITEELRNEIYDLTKETSKSLRNESIARIDFLYDNLNQKLYVNEINTIPGALSYYLFEEKGIYFDQLIDQLINFGLKRDYKNKELVNNFTSNVLNQQHKSSKIRN